jgi:hypothetical protein
MGGMGDMGEGGNVVICTSDLFLATLWAYTKYVEP